jgi:uncharacterized membrane protein YkvA (DUF1232 family)
MKLIAKIKSFGRSLREELQLFRLILKDPRTPLLPKLLLALAIGYLLSPVDIIPDFIPVLGQLDDVIIVPALIYSSLKLIPENIIAENRSKINELNSK